MTCTCLATPASRITVVIPLQTDHLKFQIVSDGSDDFFQMMVKKFQTVVRGMTRMSEASLYLIISDICNFRPECTSFQILSRWFRRSPDYFQIACSDSQTPKSRAIQTIWFRCLKISGNYFRCLIFQMHFRSIPYDFNSILQIH